MQPNDLVPQARALTVRPGETLDETDARFIAQRLADEVEALRAKVAGGISWNGFNLYGDQKSMKEVQRLMFVESRVAYLEQRHKDAMDKRDVLARRIAAADALAEVVRPLADLVTHADNPGRDFMDILRRIGNNITLKMWRALAAALAAYQEASR